MTSSRDPKKFLSLDNVRIYPNRDRNTFDVIASSKDLPGGFILSLPAGSMEDKVRAYFQQSGILEQQQVEDVKLPSTAYINYGTEDILPVQTPVLQNQHLLSDVTKIPEHPLGKIITVTSEKGGAGKTTTSVLLGSVLNTAKTKDGRPLKVVVVDLDIFDSQLHHIVGKPNDVIFIPTSKGKMPTLFDMKDVEVSLDDMTASDFLSHVVYSKSLGVHALLGPADRFLAKRIPPEFYERVIVKLREYFDVVIVDTGVNHEHSVLADVALPLADKVLLIARLDTPLVSTRNWIKHATTSKERGGFGIPLNKIKVAVKGAVLGQGMWEAIQAAFYRTGLAGSIPLDGTAVQEASNKNHMEDLLKYHPLFGSVFRGLAEQLLGDYGVQVQDKSMEQNDETVPAVFNVHSPENIVIGMKPDKETLSIDFAGGDKDGDANKNIFVTQSALGAGDVLVGNMVEFMRTQRPGRNVFLHGFDVEYEGTTTVKSNLELLSVLRNIESEVAEGNDLNQVVMIGSTELLGAGIKNGSPQSKVDSAVCNEILDLILFGLNGKVQFVFRSLNHSWVLDTLLRADNRKTHVYFGSTKRNRKTENTIFGREISGLSPSWPAGRAYVESDDYSGMIQAFEVYK